MLRLLQSTEVKKTLPKTGLYNQFGWNASQRDRFDADVSRLDFVNWISPRTLPAIAEGKDVKEIFVVEVTLKRKDFDAKNIELLGKSIPQKIVYLMRFGDEVILGVYHLKLFLTSWHRDEGASIRIEGLNLDAVWDNIVSSIGQFSVETDKSLSEQIKVNEERAKNERQIAALEKQLNTTKQPRKKREFYLKIQELKSN